MHTVCLYSPFPTCATLVGAPSCARRVQGGGGCTISSPLPRGVCATPPRCANGECRVAHKGTPSPFRPLPPLRSNRTGSAGPPAAPPFITPPFMHKRGLVRAPTGHENAGTRHNPPPLACHSPKRVCTQTGGGPPPPFCSFPAHANGVRRRRRPNRARDRGARRDREDGRGTQPVRQAPLPPFACGNALPPFAMPPCAYNGAAPEGMRTGGGAEGERVPPRIACAHDPTCVPRARPLRPTFRVPCTVDCERWGAQVGRAG